MTTSHAMFDCSTVFGVSPQVTQDLSVERLLAVMAKNGVERALTVSLRGAFFDFVEGNDETLAVTSRHEQLIPVATLDPRAALDFTDEISRMTDQGVRVFRFFPSQQGWSLSSLPFLRCLEQLNGKSVVLMLPYPGSGSCGTLLTALRDLELPVILTSAPYSQSIDVVRVMQANARIHVGTRLLSSPTLLGGIRDAVGVERLLFESGASEFYVESAIGIVEHSNLEEQEKEQVFGANLTRLLEV